MIYTLSTSRRRGLFFTTREFESIPVSSTSSARGAPRIAPPEVLEVRTRRRPGDPSERMPAIDFGTLLAVERDRRRRASAGAATPASAEAPSPSSEPVVRLAPPGVRAPISTTHAGVLFFEQSIPLLLPVLALLGSARSRRDTSSRAEREQFDVRGSVRNVRAVAVASRHRPGSWRRGRARRPLGSGETIPEYKGLPPARLPRPSR